MSLTYTTWVATLSNLTVIDSPDADFQQILPECIDYAEQRIYRELDLLDTTISDINGTLTPNTRFFAFPSTTVPFVTVKQIAVITPVGGITSASVYNQLTPVSLDVISAFWPSNTPSSTPSIPTMFCMFQQDNILVGPPPDAAYGVAIIGTIRPQALSIGNSTTFLTTNLPDLFVAASMVFMSGYMRNFGSQADDPKMAQSWETQYQTLFASANVEENRKKFTSNAWGSLQPTPIATAGR